MADEIACKRGEDKAPEAAGHEHDEILSRLSPAGTGEGREAAVMREERGFGGQMLEIGSVVYVRYLDHVLFKDAEPQTFGPFVREAIGWLDYEASDFIRLTWERSVENGSTPVIKTKATGLVVLKADILEMKPINKIKIYQAKVGIIEPHEKNRYHDKNFQAHNKTLERAGKEGRYIRSDNKPAYRRSEKA